MVANRIPFIHTRRMTETATTTAITVARLKVDEQGQVLVPAELVGALGVEPGELVVARAQDGRLTIQTLQSREDEVWAIFAGNSGSMVDSLIADRRVEFRREMIESGVDEAEIEAIEQRQIDALRARG